MGQATIEKINQDMEFLTKLVIELKEQMEDCFLTPKEAEIVDVSLKELQGGEVYSLEDIKKSRNA